MVQNESADAFRPKKRGCPFLLIIPWLRRTHRDTDGVPALPTHAGPIRPFFECCDDLCRRVRFSDHMARDPLLQAVQADPRQARPHVLETNVVRYPQMK